MNSISKYDIKKIATDNRINPTLVERHIRALEIAEKIQTFDKNVHLFGGTAAQLFLQNKFQRTSQDVDLITNYDYDHIEKLVEEFCKNEGIKFGELKSRHLKSVYGRGFSFPYTTEFGGDSGPLKIEIVSKPEEKFTISDMKNCNLYGINIGSFRVLNKIDILSKKIVTLDLDNVGMKRTQREIEISKQIYDIKRLYDTVISKEAETFRESITSQFMNDIIGNIKVESCMKNVCEVLDSLSFVRTDKSAKDTKMFEVGYQGLKSLIPYSAVFTLHEWASIGWSIKHLLQCVLEDNENGDNSKVVRHFEIRDKFREDTLENKKIRSELLIDLGRKLPKPVKGKPTESLYFVNELLKNNNL